MLKLSAGNAEIGSGCDGGVEVQLRLRNRLLGVHSRPAADMSESEVFLIGLDGLLIEVQEGILPPHFEKVDGEIRLLCQSHVCQIGSACLGCIGSLAN